MMQPEAHSEDCGAYKRNAFALPSCPPTRVRRLLGHIGLATGHDVEARLVAHQGTPSLQRAFCFSRIC